MKTFSTSCSIDAPSTKVWSVLTDLQAWPKWNTTVPKVEGTVALGNRITVYTKASPGRAFPVKVASLNAPREMVWVGGTPLARAEPLRQAAQGWSAAHGASSCTSLTPLASAGSVARTLGALNYYGESRWF